MKKLVAVIFALLMLGTTALGLAENVEISLNLSTATDEELAEAAALIKAEQKARLKTTIAFEPAELSINKGKTVKVTATVEDLPDGVTAGELTWSISDTAVATVNKGNVRAVDGGTTSLVCATILSDGTEVSAELPVTVLVPITGMTAVNPKMEVMAGDTFVPEIRFQPENASNKEVTYTSSDPSVVKEENGQLVAVAAGKANITVSATDDSKRSTKVAVTVTKLVGKYDEELTFQGLEWGSDFESNWKKLQEIGLADPERNGYVYNTSYMYYWPKEDLYFARYNLWNNLPVVFEDHQIGIKQLSFTPQKKIGGYSPDSVNMYYLNPILEDGTIDGEGTRLASVCIRYDNEHERGADIFNDLLSKMEAQYGEFTRYLAKDFTRRYYKETYDAIKNSMEGAKQYKTRELGKDIYLSDYAICILKGKNNTGIMLMMDTSEYVTLFYGKTDVLDDIAKLQEILEAIPDDREDAGI